MAMQYRANRIETPERWAKALARAIENGIEPLQIAGTGEWVVTSATKLTTVYRTDGVRCECEAGLAGDPVCQHRAVVRQILGCFDRPQAAPETVECAACHGKGWNYVEAMGGRAFPYQVECRRCGGSGQMPVRLRTAAAQPTTLAAD